jgi:hypothetical protein
MPRLAGRGAGHTVCLKSVEKAAKLGAMPRLLTAILCAVFLQAPPVAAPAAAQQNHISIGTGGVTGVYYPTGGAICRRVNEDRKLHGFRCWVESTNGSIDNIEAIRAGELQFGVVQSDWQFHAFNGSSSFKEAGAYSDLRSVFSIYPEPVTIVAREDAEVAVLSDLRGRRVNIGSKGSGARATWEVLEQALPWSREDFAEVTELDAIDTGDALCAGEIDAYFWVVGHPSTLTQETLASCPANLVEVTGAGADVLIDKHPFYTAVTIPAGLYNDNDAVRTFGVAATLVTSSNVSADRVYTLVKAIFSDLDAFKLLHPAFADLDPKRMLTESLSAPLHEGAEKAYRELGLMD